MRKQFVFIFVTSALISSLGANSLTESIDTIRKVGPEGAGNTEAAAAWQSLVEEDASAVVPLLKSMEGSGPLAKNWLRSALEVVFSKAAKESPDRLPIAEIREFLFDKSQASAARKLAFDLIESVDKKAAAELKPQFLNDPSPELRLGSVEIMIQKGRSLLDEGKKDESIAALQTALDSARDVDQIKVISKLLREKADQEVDLPRHFGFLMYWHVVGPFDNTNREGFARVYPPEEGEIDLAATYQGKTREVTWREYSTSDEYGMVDFNQPYNPLKGVVGYAYTEFQSDEDRPAELRLGCKNGWKIWFNGQYVFGRDEYHRGMRIDQYKMPIQLKKGTNTILVKACQDEQEKDWTKEWQFQLRVCDSTGTAILSTDRKPTPPKQQAPRRRPEK